MWDQAAIAASTEFNPEVAVPLMGARAAQEALTVAQRTAKKMASFGRKEKNKITIVVQLLNIISE